METLKINKKEALERLASLEKETKMLREIIETPINVMERIKTFEDACNILGETHNIKILLSYNGINQELLAAQAFLKLTIIARALNEGWKPDWTNSSEYKYYPWFDMSSGSGLAYFDYVYWASRTFAGSRLCFKSKELAEYAGKQFADIYSTMFIIK